MSLLAALYQTKQTSSNKASVIKQCFKHQQNFILKYILFYPKPRTSQLRVLVNEVCYFNEGKGVQS